MTLFLTFLHLCCALQSKKHFFNHFLIFCCALQSKRHFFDNFLFFAALYKKRGTFLANFFLLIHFRKKEARISGNFFQNLARPFRSCEGWTKKKFLSGPKNKIGQKSGPTKIKLAKKSGQKNKTGKHKIKWKMKK